MSIPDKKAAGPDLVIAEAMKTEHKRQAEFLTNLWRPVGRTDLFRRNGLTVKCSTV